MERLTGALTGTAHLTGGLTALGSLSGEISRVTGASDFYTGDYLFTPSEEEQTVPISGLTALDNIKIEPIPKNYGLITWNGSVITVS